MLVYVIVFISTVAVAGLTFFSGFGLGTLLMPVLAIFFPVEYAIMATALVHGANNVFKLLLVKQRPDRELVMRFGVPALMAAIVGAFLMSKAANITYYYSYDLFGHAFRVTVLKSVVAILMLAFAMFELVPAFSSRKFARRYLIWGGMVSGFFGGFSGHQGALRSAFLAKVDISAGTFVATNAAVGLLVDTARLMTYAITIVYLQMGTEISIEMWSVVAVAVSAALIATFVARSFLNKVTMKAVQRLTGVMLIGIAIALAMGFI